MVDNMIAAKITNVIIQRNIIDISGKNNIIKKFNPVIKRAPNNNPIDTHNKGFRLLLVNSPIKESVPNTTAVTPKLIAKTSHGTTNTINPNKYQIV